MIKVTGVEGKVLSLDVELGECRNCHNPMLPRFAIGGFPFHDAHQLQKLVDDGVLVLEAGYEAEVPKLCQGCLKVGGFLRECDLCRSNSIFPDDFAFRLTRYSEYPGGDTETDYVCCACVENKPRELVKAMAAADDIKDLKGVRAWILR